MNWKYEYEKTIKFIIREIKRPEKFMCPLSFTDITKDICHGVDTCLECFNKYYPANRELHLLWIPRKSIPMPDKNQDTMIARRGIWSK